jgi:hypothetical protein
VNQHFELVKEEVRLQVARSQEEVIATVSEVSDHAADDAKRLAERIDALEQQVEQLARVVDDLRLVTAQLAHSVAPLLERVDGPPS